MIERIDCIQEGQKERDLKEGRRENRGLVMTSLGKTEMNSLSAQVPAIQLFPRISQPSSHVALVTVQQ